MYEGCYLKFPEKLKGELKPTRSTVLGFTSQVVWPKGTHTLLMPFEDAFSLLKKTILADFLVISSDSRYNIILRRTGI